VEQDQPPRRSLRLLKLPPCLDPLSNYPPKRHRVNKCGTYICTSQACDHPTMSTKLDTNISRIPPTPMSSVISGIRSTPLSSVMWMSEAPSSSASQPMSSSHPTGTNPFAFPYGMPHHDS
jgi:hypothetical protein